MDLSDIDQWSRALLQNEARKRRIRNPEMYSRGELVKMILRHDYGSPRSVREAAKLVGGLFGSAKLALRAGLGMAEARLERGFERTGPTRSTEREVVPVAAEREPQSTVVETFVPTYAQVPRADVPAAAISPWDAPEEAAPSEPKPAEEATAESPDSQPTAAGPSEIEELSYEPHPGPGLLLRWRVGSAAIHRARAVLGAHGELALRVITVRVQDGLHVRTETLDHGPIDGTGDWTAPLDPNAARYVSSVGLRSGDRFVSIVHAAT